MAYLEYWLILSSLEGWNAGNFTAGHQSVDVVGAFISVDGLSVSDCLHQIVVMQDAVAPHDLSAPFGDFPQPFSHIGLGHGDLADADIVLVNHLGNTEDHQSHSLCVSHDLHKFLLDHLES